jgi:hypothetical protein
MTPIRPSKVVQVAESVGATLLQLLVGLLFLAGGIVLSGYAFTHEQHTVGFVGVGAAVFGALVLPGLFAVVKPIVVFIFPNGIPLIGGRRASDPPKAP